MRPHPSGNYIVEGRKKDLINRAGEKISAEEIENFILSHPSVLNAGVFSKDGDMVVRMKEEDYTCDIFVLASTCSQ